MTEDSSSSSHALVRSKRFGLAAIICFGLGLSLVVQPPGWAQASYYALIRAMDNGTAQIDKYHWETGDKSWINNHFFSVKSPGMPVVLLPAYAGLKAVGFQSLSNSAGAELQKETPGYAVPKNLKLASFGGSRTIALEVRKTSAESALMIWVLTLLGCIIPALVILLIVRSLAERWEPGTGAASSIALGMGTLLLPFSGLFFSHVMAALVLFGAFAVLLHERRGPPSLKLVVLGGLLAGFAVFVEYPLAFGGAVVGLYAAFRGEAIGEGALAVIKRGLTYAGGVIVGVIPIGIYNAWAFGSVTTMSYQDTVTTSGRTGHDVIGLVNSGLFGIGVPKLLGYTSILFSPRGLIALTPVVLMAAVGVVLMYRRGLKAEALTILGVVLIYWTYVAGYIWPVGGQVPGPRYMIPMLPFIGLGLPFAWKRLPSATTVSAVAGGTVMVAATITVSTVKEQGLGLWWLRIKDGHFGTTIFTLMGGGTGWGTILPTLILFAAAPLLAAAATSGLDFARDRLWGFVCLAGWLVLAALVAPHVREVHDPGTVSVSGLPHGLIATAALLSLIALGVASIATRRSSNQPAPNS